MVNKLSNYYYSKNVIIYNKKRSLKIGLKSSLGFIISIHLNIVGILLFPLLI